MATNITIQTISTGDNELMRIDVYLAARFGPGSDKARTTMQELSQLKKMLADEVVHFVFEKADGTTRDAYGTRAVDVIRRYENSPAHNPQRAFKGTFPYFDIEKGEWRCFKVDKFVRIDRDYTI